MKPVAAGCDERGANADVDALRAASDVEARTELINPYRFAPAIAPHIAASEAGVAIDLDHILDCYRSLCALADAVIVEGACGFLLPLGEGIDGGDLAQRLALPVVLVVGMRLGCLNHAALTAAAIAARGLPLAGWVANCVDPNMARCDENLATLRARLNAPLLGVVPHLQDAAARRAAGYLDAIGNW